MNLQSHTRVIASAVFTPDGAFVLTSSLDSTAKIWRCDSERCWKTLKGHTSPVPSAVFSPAGAWVLTGSDDNTAKIWSCDSGECLKTLQGIRTQSCLRSARRAVRGSLRAPWTAP
jgi:WD40 repeat protein